MIPVEIQKMPALCGPYGLITVSKHAHHDFASWHKQIQSKPCKIISLKSICTSVSQLVSFLQVFCPYLCMHFSFTHLCLCPIYIILLKLFPLLHNIPNCYNTNNHVNSIMKTKTSLEQNDYLLAPWELTDENKTSMYTSTEHLPSFLSQQEIFLHLSVAEFLVYLLQENVKSFLTFKLSCYNTWRFLCCKWFDLQES
jgi:hypothetical protein